LDPAGGDAPVDALAVSPSQDLSLAAFPDRLCGFQHRDDAVAAFGRTVLYEAAPPQRRLAAALP
jgi:hypothetical protein